MSRGYLERHTFGYMKQKGKLIHILSVFCVVFLSSIFLMFGIQFGFMNETIVLNSITESEYYYESYEEFTQTITSILEQADLPVTVITDEITKSQFYMQGRAYAKNCLKNPDHTQQEDSNQMMKEIIQSYYESSYFALDEEADAELEVLAKSVSSIYDKMIENQFVQVISKWKQRYQDKIWIAVAILTGLVIVTCILMFSLEKQVTQRFMQLFYLCISSFGINLIISVLFLHRMDVSDITPSYYAKFVSCYINTGVIYCIFSSIALLILGGICIGCANIMHKKGQKKEACRR